MASYPEVRLEIVAEDRKVDPVEDDYDVVIRVDPAPDDTLVGRPFLRDERWFVAPPQMPRPPISKDEAAKLAVKAVVLSNTSADVVWHLRTLKNRKMVVSPAPALRFSSLLMVRDAVLAGAGVALLPKLLVADDVASGRLAQWGTQDGPAVEVWALQSSRRLIGAKVRAFLDILEKTFPGKSFGRRQA